MNIGRPLGWMASARFAQAFEVPRLEAIEALPFVATEAHEPLAVGSDGGDEVEKRKTWTVPTSAMILQLVKGWVVRFGCSSSSCVLVNMVYCTTVYLTAINLFPAGSPTVSATSGIERSSLGHACTEAAVEGWGPWKVPNAGPVRQSILCQDDLGLILLVSSFISGAPECVYHFGGFMGRVWMENWLLGWVQLIQFCYHG